MSLLHFVREFVRDPVSLGAIAPSGRSLARITVEAAQIGPEHAVVELGAGTGPMTREIQTRHPDAALLVLEVNPVLADGLRTRFPEVEVVERSAEHLAEAAREWGHPAVDRVVSSLPWAIWPHELQQRVFDGVVGALAPQGRMVTFSYVHSQALPAARRFKRALKSRFERVDKTRVAWRNLPPAFVFVCDGPRH